MKIRATFLTATLASFASLVLAQDVARDPGTAGPALETVFLYNDQWPTGIAVSSTGRLFSNYPLGLDYTNTRYQVAELHPENNTQTPYPSTEINTPPGGAVDNSTYPPTAKGLPDYLIGVQSVVIDPKDRLWILDTGRVQTSNGTLLTASYGGPKLIGIDLQTNSIFQTIVFPPTVAYGDSYLNDVRFDLRPSITESGQGIAYITDSSSEGRNAIVIVDLGTGSSWRRLENIPQVRPDPGFLVTVWGEPIYSSFAAQSTNKAISRLAFGADGITLSADGETLYFCPVSTRNLYAVPTSRLRVNNSFPAAELLATSSVMNLGQKGVSDGLESDSNGVVYGGSIETNSIFAFHPGNGTVTTFLRDPRIEWTDTFSVVDLNTSGNGNNNTYGNATAGTTTSYLYFTENQLFRAPGQQGGIDRRVKPFVLYRVPLIGNGTKISLR